MVTKSLPRSLIGPIADRLKHMFLRRFTIAQGTNVVGRLIPFGIGAVIGGGGNHLLGRQIVRASREGFGPPPAEFPEWLVIVPRAPKQPRAPRSPREPRPVGSARERRIPLPRLPKRAPRELEAAPETDVPRD
jgi:hypothetical protein